MRPLQQKPELLSVSATADKETVGVVLVGQFHRERLASLCPQTLRDLSGSYSLLFYGCIALELIAAVLVMFRGKVANAKAARLS